ncbi:hypothetical protein C7960_0892 [Methanohalophilus euhalobius]|uniref:ECF transporter S component n=2 Tax=Methanohalophilus euhalobius TaxID=51203 RepID=A0A3M9LDF1_9EURY|nr:MAG: hypothetical protein A8273_309 [Methanohalophilus sp. 2-GBenrich]RNI10493.1 hypothetical protein EDD83_03785 [Methanohalophilus euhalobius]TCL11712.1 hypothetical protein C7960_0892 [Methanohalophilus euhalobius]
MLQKTYSMISGDKKIRKLHLLVAFVATYFAIWFPDIQGVLGMENVKISSTLIFGTLNGLLLGPVYGAIVSLAAISVHRIVHVDMLLNNPFYLISPLFIASASLVAGLAITGKKKRAIILPCLLIAIWFATGVGREVFYYPWLHVLSIVFFLTFTRIENKISFFSKNKGYLYLFACSLLAVSTDHLAGSLSALFISDFGSSMYKDVIFIYPLERILIAIISALIFYAFIVWINLLKANASMLNEKEEHNVKDVMDYINREVKDIIEKEK